MAISILDATTSAAVAAATTQYAQVRALINAWGGGNVTVRILAGSTLLSSSVYGPWTHNRVPTPDQLTLGAIVSRTWSANGTPTTVVFRYSSTDIFSMTAGVGSGDIQFTGTIKQNCTEDLSAMVITAKSSLPNGGPPYPTWRDAMSAQTWRKIPTSNYFSDLNPRNNAAINPVYPSQPEWAGSGYGQLTMFDQWTGGCYDQVTDTWWMPLGGGHSAYGGNEVYKIMINDETPTWVLVRAPTGSLTVGAGVTTNDGNEASGVYADGRPRAVHSYNKPVYVPGDGPWLAVMGAAWHSGSNGLIAPLQVNTSTGEGTVKAAIPAGISPIVARTSAGGACYDTARNAIWFRVSGTGYIFKYDITNNTWSQQGPSLAGGTTVGMCYLPTQDLIAIMDGATFRIFDPNTATYSTPSTTGSTTGAALSVNNASNCGAQPFWTGTDIAWWENASNTTVISKITPPGSGSWKTGTWTIGEYPVSVSNAVTPSVKNIQGTFGRFAYSPVLKGFFLFNAGDLIGGTDKDIYFYAIE